MVLVKELHPLRIVLPITLEEYEVGLWYAIMKMEQQNTNSKEGVEILENSSFEDEKLGKGLYTSKIYNLQSKLPAWLKAFAPPGALTVEEESWTAYPKSKTVIKCPYFSQCSLSVETVNKADNGCSENVHGLSEEQLASRKVEIIDIASPERDYWSKIIAAERVDLSTFRSTKTGRGPLLKGWKDHCRPVMTTYKLVIMDAPIWGFGCRLEETVLAIERALFLELHKRCFAFIDEWFGMTMEQLSEMAKENKLLLKKTLQKTSLGDCKEEFKKRNKRQSHYEEKSIIASYQIDSTKFNGRPNNLEVPSLHHL